MEHNRRKKIYIGETNNERIGDTIFYKHKYFTMPTRTKAEAIEEAAKDLKKALISIAIHIDIHTKVLILSELGMWLLRAPQRLAVAIVH